MAFKWYHGKTGVVWNVTKRAVGVEVNKTVRACCFIYCVNVTYNLRYVCYMKCRDLVVCIVSCARCKGGPLAVICRCGV
jgi:hypothetical protein